MLSFIQKGREGIAVACAFVAIFLVFDALGYLGFLWGNSERLEFWRDVLVLVLGIPTGWAVVSIQRSEESNELKRREETRRNALLAELSESAKANAVYTKQVVGQLNNSAWPTFRMDVVFFASSTHLWHDVIQELDLASHAGKLLFELNHLNERLSLLPSIMLSSGSDVEFDSPDNLFMYEKWLELLDHWEEQECLTEFLRIRNFDRALSSLPKRHQFRMYDVVVGTIMLADSTHKACIEFQELVEQRVTTSKW